MVATKEQYQNALLKIRDKGKLRNTKYLEMLRAQYASPNHTITATKIAEAVGYENYNAANLQYGTLGHEIADILGYVPPKRDNGEPMWFWTLSFGNDASDKTLDGHYEFVMRPQLVAALEGMRWVK
ncbi:hypothetical protein MOY_05100 [Halomonas sp. GFAJ-1]|nr:hypothetical protein BB497_07810 [Halomonas sp. GFAJ-1]EHK61672.1 hypothetical protein MOY_05100 [Halomonas sp. GFAJ-1]